MKTQLIKPQDKFILVSDEEIKDGNLCLDTNSNQIFTCWKNKPNDGIYEWKNNQSWARLHKNCRKIIAGIPELPAIDFSSDELGDEGFKTTQSLNDKMFSLEDIRNMFILGGKHKVQNPDVFLDKMEDIIQSLQQTSWDVEVETFQEGHFHTTPITKPKITNNSIKVIKIL